VGNFPLITGEIGKLSPGVCSESGQGSVNVAGFDHCRHGIDELRGIYRLRQVHLKTRGARFVGIFVTGVRGQRNAPRRDRISE
jgi:hypothetical protein